MAITNKNSSALALSQSYQLQDMLTTWSTGFNIGERRWGIASHVGKRASLLESILSGIITFNVLAKRREGD